MRKSLMIVGILAGMVTVANSALAADVVVGSKIDTEGGVLGNIILLVLKANNIPVVDKIQLGATPIVREAILQGQIDIYPEYTGNAAFFFNKGDLPVWNKAEAGYEEAKKLDYDANKIVWLTPANANNTWAIAVRHDVAEKNNLKSLTDFGKYVNAGGEVKLAASSEFVSSATALPAFQTAYSFTLKPDQLITLSGVTRQRQSLQLHSKPQAPMRPWSMAPMAASKLLILRCWKTTRVCSPSIYRPQLFAKQC